MPLLRRQPFVKQKPPHSVKQEDEVFFCRLTGEVFDDYEKFFERIILCNSLVWTCDITGKSGLTYQEAVESEEKALKQLASFPVYFQKPILHLATLTHRPRLNDVNDDVFTYVKDRYFIGEVVDVVQGGERKVCSIIQVIAPTSKTCKPNTNGLVDSGSDSDVICLDDPVPVKKSPKTPKGSPKPGKSPKKNKQDSETIEPSRFQYVVQEGKKSNIYIVKADQISRKKGLYTRDKSKLFLKLHCENAGDGIWRVKPKYVRKFRLHDTKFADFFEGPPPRFAVVYSKKKPSKSTTVIDLTEEDDAIRKAKKDLKAKKKDKKQKEGSVVKKKKKIEHEKMHDSGDTSKGKKCSKHAHTSKKHREELLSYRKITDFITVHDNLDESCQNTTKFSVGESDSGHSIDQTSLIIDEIKPIKMTQEERIAMRERIKAEKLAEKLEKKEEMKKLWEEEKLKRKEEREKLRLLKIEEKTKREQLIKEWSKPREDMECDDLKDMPLPNAINCHFPTELFGDVLMVLEYMKCFRSLFDLEEDFPHGIELEDLGKGIISSDTNGLFADILRFLLGAVFNLQEEEDEDDNEIDDLKDAIINDLEEGESVSYKQLVDSATAVAQWPNMTLGAPLKKLHLDGFTITEIVRLHFLSSGSRASDKSVKFRYQQRGGYTSYDDAGLEFRKQESAILKALGEMNIFDFPAGDKLKVLIALINQLLTFVTSRDFVEDNYERLRQVRNDSRQLQWEEQRRDREESTFWYKKRLEERQKEKDMEAEKKAQKKKEKEDKIRSEEGSPSKPIDLDKDDKEEQDGRSKSSPNSKDAERKSSRQRAILIAKEEKEDLPVDNIDWEKVTPNERIRMKDRFLKKESELGDLIQELTHSNAIYCLGRDRTFRRYWVFQSLPGLFVEDLEEHIPDDFLQPVEQSGASNPLKNESTGSTPLIEDKCTSSDKENESFDGTSGLKKSISSNNLADEKNIKSTHSADSSVIYESLFDQIQNRNKERWAYYNTPEQIGKLIAALNPRGFREGPLKQTLLEQKSHLTNTVDQCPVNVLSLPKTEGEGLKGNQAVSVKVKSRNKTTQGTVQNGSAQEFLELNLRESLLDLEERIFVGTLGSMMINNREKWRDAMETGSFDQQCETLVWAGKAADHTSPSKHINGHVAMDIDIEEEASPVVRDLAKALLQISQGIEPKYLGQPLGNAVPGTSRRKSGKQTASKGKASKSKGKNKSNEEPNDNDDSGDSGSEDGVKQPTLRERWEQSLMSSTSLPQLFLYMSVLDSSILWSKSSLHARCRICRRKGDGEHMLLCDGCDRGHHMYCLKPQVKKVPQGDWFCLDCKPKEVPRTPRKRRKSFIELSSDEDSDEDDQQSDSDNDEESDEQSCEESEESAESSDDNSEEEEEDDDDDDDDDEESDASEEDKPVKIKFIRGLRKQPTSGRSTPTSEGGKKGLKSSNSTSSLYNGRSNKAKAAAEKTSGRAGSRHSLESSKCKVSRKSLETSKGRRSQEPEKPLKNGRQGQLQVKGLRVSRSASCLADLGRGGNKRKAHNHEDSPEPKRASLSKVRGGEEIQQMKLLEDLLTELCDRKESWPFMTPVTKRDAPDYFDIVKKPMDFRTIRSKILKIEYLEPGPIIQDIRLTFKNCEQYNMQTVPEYSAGQKMSRYFEKKLKELKLDQIVSKSATKTSPSPKKKQRRI